MTKVRTWVGLDVHAATVVACVVDAESGEMTVQRLPGATADVVAFCVGRSGPTRVAYEAGPTGFGLARALLAAGVWCVIAAPGKIERPAQDKVKTDRRDAGRLVRLLMIDGLHTSGCPAPRRRLCATWSQPVSRTEVSLGVRGHTSSPLQRAHAPPPNHHECLLDPKLKNITLDNPGRDK